MDQSTQDRTALVIARQLWGWGGWALGVTLAAAARQLLVQSVGDVIVEGVLQAIGAALLAGGICVIVIWLVYTFWKISPSQKLRLMRRELVCAKNELGVWLDRDTVRAEDSSSIRTLIRNLDRIKVPHPSMGERGSIWYAYITRIIGEADAGAIDEARLVWREMQDSNAIDNPSTGVDIGH